MTTREHYFKMKEILNIKEYHDKGFMGQGVTVCSMESYSDDSHGNMVRDTVMTYAPKCKFISYSEEKDISSMGDDNVTQQFPIFVDWCIEHKVDIITSSLDWQCDKESEQKAIKKLYDNGIIFCNCAGNDGDEIHLGNTKKTYGFDKEVIAVSGYMHDTKGKFTYSRFNYGEAVDILGWGEACCVFSDGNEENSCYAWSGTSAATPFIAGLLAIYKSYDNKLNSKNVFSLLNNSYIPLIYKEKEYKILTLPKMEDNFKLIGEDIMQDKDEELTSEWAKESRKYLMEQGITDGTNPLGTITRQEVWTMLYRLLKLYQ